MITTAATFDRFGQMGKARPLLYSNNPRMLTLSKSLWLPCILIAAVLLAWPYQAKTQPIIAVQSFDKLDAYLSRLAWNYECMGECAKAQKQGLPFKIIDSNGLYSYGCLQFQQATYLAFAKKYKIDPWGNGGIYNCENQMAIARAMFEEDKKGASFHWFTSIYKRGLGLPQT